MTHIHPAHRAHVSQFWGHFFKMLGIMVVSMVAGGFLLVTVTGQTSWEATTLKYPNQALGIMAFAMSVPMGAWMLHRGMGWKNTIEMGAAMVVPVFPFFCLVWFHVTKGAECGGYCALSGVAMLGLMLYRRREYSMEM